MNNSFAVDGVVAAAAGGADHSLAFTVLGSPRSQERPRIQRYSGPMWMYDPSSAAKKAYFRKVNEALVEMGLTNLPFFTPTGTPNGSSREERVGLMAEIHFLIPRPPSHFRPGTRVLKPSAPVYPRQKDIDNMLKFTLDALQGVVYKNDSSIRSVRMDKEYTCAKVGSTNIFFKVY
jgi:Holliday junction resolvase RusA-like endonuclease